MVRNRCAGPSLKPAVEVPPHPAGYRAIYSRDGRSVVIKHVDAAGRAKQISNPLGPAILSVDTGPKWYIAGVELSEDEWRQTVGEASGG